MRGQNTTQDNTLQHTATHCNTLQHTATHYNTLQHTATPLIKASWWEVRGQNKRALYKYPHIAKTFHIHRIPIIKEPYENTKRALYTDLHIVETFHICRILIIKEPYENTKRALQRHQKSPMKTPEEPYTNIPTSPKRAIWKHQTSPTKTLKEACANTKRECVRERDRQRYIKTPKEPYSETSILLRPSS